MGFSVEFRGKGMINGKVQVVVEVEVLVEEEEK